MDYHHALQLRSMLAVMQPNGEAFLRQVKRFYSKTFSVPLPDVDDIPEEDVLVAFYEENFGNMTEEERGEFLDDLLATPEERAAREKAHERADERDEEFMKKLSEDVKSGKRRGPPPERRKLKLPEGPTDPKERAKAIKAAIARGFSEPDSTDGPLIIPPPPDIHMKFGEDGSNLPGIPAEWLDMDPSAPPSPKK